MDVNRSSSLLKKLILHPGHPGTGELPYPNGTKVQFHVKSEALICNEFPEWPPTSPTCQGPEYEGKLVDDSRNWKHPVELLLGKKFKMEVWEECVNTMKKDEIAVFLVDKKLVSSYPIVSQTLRKALSKDASNKPKTEEKSHHCCGMGLKEGLGHADLDELITNPKHMKFTMELVKVELPGCYEKQYWEMSEDERLSSVPDLKEAGNALYKQGNTSEASQKYREAIGRLENLMLKEKPNDIEWNSLNESKIPILLNYSQCQLLLGEYYSVIEHCTTVIEHQPENVKALFRRGKAYCELVEGEPARSDLAKCVQLDPATAAQVNKLLAGLALQEKRAQDKDKKTYANLFSKTNE